MLCAFLALGRSSYLQTGIGAYHVNQTITPEDPLILNITYYPFYIIFREVPETVDYIESSSRSTSEQAHDYFSNGKQLPLYRAFELPRGQITFTASTTSEIKFSYVSMPGLCQKGVYFSTSSQDSLVLAPTGKDFFKLRNYDDKCFIFTEPVKQEAHIELTAQDAGDLIYIYRDFYNYECISGVSHINRTVHIGNATNPSVIRIVTDRKTPPRRLALTLNKGSGHGTNSAVHTPRHREEPCEVVKTWYSEELVITLIICSVFMIMCLVFLVICKFKQSRVAGLLSGDEI